MTEICSKMVSGLLKDARKATCLPRISSAPSMNRLGNPSGNLAHDTSIGRMSRRVGCVAIECASSFMSGQ